MKREIIDELLKILQEISEKEAVIKEVKRFDRESIFSDSFDCRAEIQTAETEVKFLKDKYNELTIKLIEYNY